ncbi:low molecular weight protein arginine phosphatase [Macrococcus sp. DPC7161]|uniref:low molecular weight protein arginine phosphatase n=1 Tax=Macrococcus sp. DPC7161 TaxID=2507060 RepID=UPI00100BBF6C|nr:low molecular weight protein arginine phosphatase [Macrococcus sp. DPC7161]RXK17565.1 low molecular weight protein arginine phosphatase [Macrococcus sp. DPC7161]
MKVLFVCTGNTCRSPMAESIAKSLSHEHEFASRGISAMDGAETSTNTLKVIQTYELKPVSNASLFTQNDLEYDLILTMTASHKNYVKALFPNDKTYTLIEYVNGVSQDIMDPYGGSYPIYEATYFELKQHIEKLIAKLSEK